MNTYKTISMGIAAAILFLPTGVISAQNPLRRVDQSGNQTFQDSQVSSASYYQDVYNQSNESTRRKDNTYGGDRIATAPSTNRASRIQSRIREPNRNQDVFLTGFEEIPRQPAPESSADTSLTGAKVLGSAIDRGWQDPKRVVDLIMKISLNLVFVLSFAFGVILIARRFTKPKIVDHSGTERAKNDSLSVLQTLRIDPKISIRLIQWRSNRFLVACDQNGIQSVNPLNESFEQTLKELDDQEAPSDEKLLRKLLSGLDLGRGQ